MVLLPLLLACAPPPETDPASSGSAPDTTTTGCGSESSLAYGQIVEYTGEWIPYVDGGEIYCVPTGEGSSYCPVNMRVPDPGVMFLFTVTLKAGDGTSLGDVVGGGAADRPAGDVCFGASGQLPLIAHDVTLGDGDEVRLEAQAVEATTTSDDEVIPVDGGQAFRAEVSGYVATSAQ